MKIKMLKLRQLIKESIKYDRDTLLIAMKKIIELLPIKCHLYVDSNIRIIVDNNEDTSEYLFIDCSTKQSTLFIGDYDLDAMPVSEDWIVEQSNCESFDQMDKFIKDSVDAFLESEIAILKDNFDIDLD